MLQVWRQTTNEPISICPFRNSAFEKDNTYVLSSLLLDPERHDWSFVLMVVGLRACNFIMLIARLGLSNVVQGMQHARTMKTQLADCNIKDHVKYQIPKEKKVCRFPGQYQNLDHSCTCMICSLSALNIENGPYLLRRWGSSKEDDHVSISRRHSNQPIFLNSII